MEHTYNGWRNHHTWRANLHLDAFLEDFIRSEEFDQILEEKGELGLIYHATHLVIEYAHELVDEQVPWSNLFIRDLISGAMTDIDFYQIAESHIMDEIRYRNLPQ